MSAKNDMDKNEKEKKVESYSPQAGQTLESYHDDPLREESTDYRAPGEKFDTLPPGKNLDLSRMDQPRTDLESLPKAHKDKESVHERKQQDANRDTDKKPRKRLASMNLSRIALITAASGFAGFGAACLIRPKGMLERVDVRAKSARGTTELRAMYGGLELGLGAFFAAAAAKDEWSRPALLAQVLGLGALAAARLAGILRDRPRGPLMKALFAAESSAAVLAAIALARRRGEIAGMKTAA